MVFLNKGGGTGFIYPFKNPFNKTKKIVPIRSSPITPVVPTKNLNNKPNSRHNPPTCWGKLKSYFKSPKVAIESNLMLKKEPDIVSVKIKRKEAADTIRALANQIRQQEKSVSIEVLKDTIGEIVKSDIKNPWLPGYEDYFKKNSGVLHKNWIAKTESLNQIMDLIKKIIEDTRPETCEKDFEVIESLRGYLQNKTTDPSIRNFVDNLGELSKRLYVQLEIIKDEKSSVELKDQAKEAINDLLIKFPIGPFTATDPINQDTCLPGANNYLIAALTTSPVIADIQMTAFSILKQDYAMEEAYENHLLVSGQSLIPGQFSKVLNADIHAGYAWSGNDMGVLVALGNHLEKMVVQKAIMDLEKLAEMIQHEGEEYSIGNRTLIGSLYSEFNVDTSFGKDTPSGKTCFGLTPASFYDEYGDFISNFDPVIDAINKQVGPRQYPSLNGTLSTLLMPEVAKDMAKAIHDGTDVYSIIKVLTLLHTGLAYIDEDDEFGGIKRTNSFIVTQFLHEFGALQEFEPHQKNSESIISAFRAKLVALKDRVNDPRLIDEMDEALKSNYFQPHDLQKKWITNGFSAWLDSQDQLDTEYIQFLEDQGVPPMLFKDKMDQDIWMEPNLNPSIKALELFFSDEDCIPNLETSTYMLKMMKNQIASGGLNELIEMTKIASPENKEILDIFICIACEDLKHDPKFCLIQDPGCLEAINEFKLIPLLLKDVYITKEIFKNPVVQKSIERWMCSHEKDVLDLDSEAAKQLLLLVKDIPQFEGINLILKHHMDTLKDRMDIHFLTPIALQWNTQKSYPEKSFINAVFDYHLNLDFREKDLSLMVALLQKYPDVDVNGQKLIQNLLNRNISFGMDTSSAKIISSYLESNLQILKECNARDAIQLLVEFPEINESMINETLTLYSMSDVKHVLTSFTLDTLMDLYDRSKNQIICDVLKDLMRTDSQKHLDTVVDWKRPGIIKKLSTLSLI